jgi:hypothetical protein
MMKRSGHFLLSGLALILSVAFIFFSAAGTLKAQTLSGEKNILSYSFPAVPGAVGIIDQTTHTITVTVLHSVARNNLIASFTHSPLSAVKVGDIDQVSGVTANDFTYAVVYTVIAENLETRNYVVSVTNAPPSDACQMTSFSFSALVPPVGGIINQQAGTISLVVPYGTATHALVAAFESSPFSTVSIGATPQVSGSTPNDFTTDKIYRVTAENGTDYKEYTVHVTISPAERGNSITRFVFEAFDPDVTGSINETAKTIALTVPFGTNLTGLVPTFTSSPFSTVTVSGIVQQSGVSAQNFTGPVPYKCIAQDGSEEIYTVTVHVAPPSTANRILTFSFEEDLEPDITGTINESAKTIALTVPYSADVSSLKATFTHSPLSVVTVDGILQISGVTPNDFSAPVLYACKAQDESTEIYTVTVTRAPVRTGNDLLTFGFAGLTGPPSITIDQTELTVHVIVPDSTDLTAMVATFTLSPYASATVSGIIQVSGVTENDFSIPVVYTVTAENGESKDYTVTVEKEHISSEKEISDFRFAAFDPDAVGIINQISGTIAVQVPYGTNIAYLVSSFTISDFAGAWVSGMVQISGETPQDFRSPVVYRIIAEDGSFRDYTVTVTIGPNTENRLYSFDFNAFDPPATGVIDETASTIEVTIPYGSSPASLIASFTGSVNSTVKIGTVVQVSGITANNFTTARTYIVQSESGAVRTYLVTVVIAPPATGNSILSFNFEVQFEPDRIGTIDQATGTIRISVPLSQDLTGLVATFTSSPYSRVRIGDQYQVSGITPNDFINTVTYVCVAQDGSTEVYQVLVSRAPASNQKDILVFRFDGLMKEAVGVIDPATRIITVHVPGESDVLNLVATFILSPYAIARVGNATQISGITPNDFRNPVTYTVVAEDNSEKTYTVRVVVGAYAGKRMLEFGFAGLPGPVEGFIDEQAKTILVYVPFSVSRANLVATFSSSARSTVWIGSGQAGFGNNRQ